MTRKNSRVRAVRGARLGLMLLISTALACAGTPLRVCPISLVDAHAGLLVLRDNAQPDEFELIASEAWLDAQSVAVRALDPQCTMRQVVARARVTAGEHRVVIASLYRGLGMWSGATWRACQELVLRFSGEEAVVVRSVLRTTLAVDPFERLGFELLVQPASAWLHERQASDQASPEAAALCRSLAGYDLL